MPRKGSGVTKETLIADLQRVHQQQGFLSWKCYDDHGRYGVEVVRLRFGSFVDACHAAGLEPRAPVVHEAEALLADLRRVYAELGYISQYAYTEHGLMSHQTMRSRFGSWNGALHAAGLAGCRSTKPKEQETKQRRCLGRGADHLFEARKDDLTHRICDACKGRTAPDPWDRITVADGWEMVGA